VSSRERGGRAVPRRGAGGGPRASAAALRLDRRHGQDTGELADQFTRNLRRLPCESLLNTWAPDPDIDITPVIGQVKTPTLVLHGTQDRRVPLATAHYLHEHLPDPCLYLSLLETRPS